MANEDNFRFGTLGEAIADTKLTELTNNYKADFFSELANISTIPKTSNHAVVISKRMWMKLTDIFFGEHDFEQRDGVLIEFGYDKTGPLSTKNLSLLFRGFSTYKIDDEDVILDENGRSMVLVDNNTLTPAYRSEKIGGGASEGGTGASQIPPASPPRIL